MLSACAEFKQDEQGVEHSESGSPYLVILGTIQDAGIPHIGCQKECCAPYFAGEKEARKVVSLGLVDPKSSKSWLFEASPNISSQLNDLRDELYHSPSPQSANRQDSSSFLPSGIFLSHAHLGHYAGLMYLGREALGADDVPVFAMPRMDTFLRTNGPWSQLVELDNIKINKIREGELILLSDSLSVEVFRVPHRDEFSETVGFKIEGPKRSLLFIPDIDKWEKWDKDILVEIKMVDLAFLDATFFSGDELPNRDISEIPHPLVEESMQLFEPLSEADRSKVHFLHFNHSNPMIDPKSEASRKVEKKGFAIAREGMVYEL